MGSPIKVKRADTVVQGLGMVTLTATNGNSVLTTADVPGIDLSGLLVDAGPVNSPVLVQIGTKNGNNGKPHNQPSDPTALQDVFFRIGGPHVGKATVSLEVNTDNTILDDLWIWRADHGVPGSVGWTVNTADTGPSGQTATMSTCDMAAVRPSTGGRPTATPGPPTALSSSSTSRWSPTRRELRLTAITISMLGWADFLAARAMNAAIVPGLKAEASTSTNVYLDDRRWPRYAFEAPWTRWWCSVMNIHPHDRHLLHVSSTSTRSSIDIQRSEEAPAINHAAGWCR